MGDIGPRTVRFEVLPTRALSAPVAEPVAAVEAPAAPVDLTRDRTPDVRTGAARR